MGVKLEAVLVEILDEDDEVTVAEYQELAFSARVLARRPDLARRWAEAIRWDLDGPQREDGGRP